MQRVRWLTAAGLVAALLLAGCGAQAQDEDDVQIIEDENEQVYIFPDGTQVVGTQAEWTERVVQRFTPPITPWKEVQLQTAGFLQYVSIPEGFHLARALTNGEVTRAIYVDPEQQWLFLLNAWHPGNPGRGWTITPNCVKEDEAGQPFQPLLDHLCRGEYLVDGWKIQLGTTARDMEMGRHLLVSSIEYEQQ